MALAAVLFLYQQILVRVKDVDFAYRQNVMNRGARGVRSPLERLEQPGGSNALA